MRYFWNFIIMGFGLPPEFSCWNLWHENGRVFAKDKFVILACSFASIAAAHSRTFFACTKKVPKKYPEGVRTLSTPGDAVKLRLRFAPHVLRRYWKFHIMRKRKMSSYSLLLSDCELTQAVFYGIFKFWLMGFGVKPEFDCLNLWQSNG